MKITKIKTEKPKISFAHIQIGRFFWGGGGSLLQKINEDSFINHSFGASLIFKISDPYEKSFILANVHEIIVEGN